MSRCKNLFIGQNTDDLQGAFSLKTQLEHPLNDRGLSPRLESILYCQDSVYGIRKVKTTQNGSRFYLLPLPDYPQYCAISGSWGKLPPLIEKMIIKAPFLVFVLFIIHKYV